MFSCFFSMLPLFTYEVFTPAMYFFFRRYSTRGGSCAFADHDQVPDLWPFGARPREAHLHQRCRTSEIGRFLGREFGSVFGVFWLWCDAGDLMLHGYHLSFGKWKKAMIKHEPVDLESIFRQTETSGKKISSLWVSGTHRDDVWLSFGWINGSNIFQALQTRFPKHCNFGALLLIACENRTVATCWKHLKLRKYM